MCNWKCTPQAKCFGKICLNAIRDNFFSICGLWSGGGWGESIFEWGWYQIEEEISNFWACRETPYPIPSLSGTSWSPHKENPDEGACSVYCNDFEKSEWEYFFSK